METGNLKRPVVTTVIGTARVVGEFDRVTFNVNIEGAGETSVEAKKKLGSGRLNLMQPTVFLEDEKSARAAARKAISIYLPLENYHRAWRERGFVDSDFAGEGTDEFVDELVVWGDDRRIATKYEEQFSCGADHLIIIPVKLDLKNELGWQRLGNIVKGAGQINA